MDALPYGRQTITAEDISAVVSVLESPFLTQGPCVPAFEQKINQKTGSSHAVASNSATSALHLACMALGLGEGDCLWTTPNTFVASANCGRYCGAQVDFVDIDADTGLMSVSMLTEKLEHARKINRLPKVLVPVHLCGTSCDMHEIRRLSIEYGFRVIEDASHAIGGSYEGRRIGGCQYSDITVFSFHPVKIITTGEGGIATTNDLQLSERMRTLRSHGITKDLEKFEKPAEGPWSYEQQQLGFNYRMTDIQAALGISQLQRLESLIDERHRLLDEYKNLLSGLPLRFLKIPVNVVSSLHLAVVRLEDDSATHHRKTFERLRRAGIGVQLHYSPVHLQPYYQRLGFKKGDFPQAEAYAHNAISLPLYPGLRDEDIERVAHTLNDILKK